MINSNKLLIAELNDILTQFDIDNNLITLSGVEANEFGAKLLSNFNKMLDMEPRYFDELKASADDKDHVNAYKDRELLIATLLLIILRYAKNLPWTDMKLQDYEQNKINSASELIYYAWKKIKSNKTVGIFEEYERWHSASINITLIQYSIKDAIKLAKMKSMFKAVSIILGTPLFSGLVVGWIFLLQASDAIRYFMRLINVPLFFNVSDLLTSDVVRYFESTINEQQFSVIINTAILTLLLMVINYFFIYAKAPILNIKVRLKRCLSVVGLYFSLALLTGYFWGYFFNGYSWIKEDVLINTTITNIDYTYSINSFIVIWAAMSVFIGIFAQIVWSGRRPTEVIE